jgi:hypothetical protein
VPIRLRKIFNSVLPYLAAILALLSFCSVVRQANFMNYALRGDFYPRWFGTREALLHGRNPYAPEVTREIQVAYYGHAARPGEENEQPFAFYYPAYVMFLIWPTMWMDFGSVRLLMSAVVGLSLLVAAFCWMKLTSFNFSWRLGIVVVLLTISSVPAIHGMLLQQLALPVVMFMAAGLLAITAGRLGLAGVWFALSTIKPPTALLPILWLLLWSLSRWHERRRFVFGLAAALAVLIAVSEFVVPGWISQFIAGLIVYNRNSSDSPILVIMFGKIAGTIAVLSILGVTAALAFKYRLAEARDAAFVLMIALVECTAVLCIPSLAGPYNQVLLLPAVFLLLRQAAMLPWWANVPFATALLLPSILGPILRLQGWERLLMIPIVLSLALPLVTAAILLGYRQVLVDRTVGA